MEDKEKLWTKDFVLVIIINFLVFLNHLMILSTFPFFIERLGYSDTVSGACATAFSLVAVLARPFVGWLLGVGLIGMALMPMGYLVIYTALASLALAILLRMVHGLSLACANTSTLRWPRIFCLAPAFRRVWVCLAWLRRWRLPAHRLSVKR